MQQLNRRQFEHSTCGELFEKGVQAFCQAVLGVCVILCVRAANTGKEEQRRAVVPMMSNWCTLVRVMSWTVTVVWRLR